MVDEETPEVKVQQYETFVNEVLRTKLKYYFKLCDANLVLCGPYMFSKHRLCLQARETCCAEIQEYLQLKKTLENLKELDVNPLKTQVDLGCGFFIQAEV